MEFEDVKETVKTVVTRLQSPVAFYNVSFTESDSMLEVAVETSQEQLPVVLLALDEEVLKVIRAPVLDPNGYSTYEYKGPLRIIALLVEYLAPVFNKSYPEVLSLIFQETIRNWKDLIRVVCDKSQVEMKDFGRRVSLLNVSIEYNLDTYRLIFNGSYEEDVSCYNTDTLIGAILSVLDYLFEINEITTNPILDTKLLEVDMDTAMGDAVDGAISGGFEGDLEGLDMGEGGMEGADGEDLSESFEPLDSGADSGGIDLDTGKADLLSEEAV